MTMRFLPDEPLHSDEQEILGFVPFVQSLQNAIYFTKPPFVYGVLGDWGVGKTSVLKLLETAFNNDLEVQRNDVPCFYVPIWFNAWKYENEANVLYPLLHKIRESYEERTGQKAINERGFGQLFRRVVTTSLFVLGNLGLDTALKVFSAGTLGAKDVQDAYKTVQEHEQEVADVLEAWTNQVDTLEKAFTDLLDNYAAELAQRLDVPTEQVRFVLLVDDLDRCLPETTISVLESIKNYLIAPRAVFILGLNPQVVYLGIRHKYGGLEISGREYLEKILNYTFYVPEPKDDRLAEFLTQRFQEITGERALDPKLQEFVSVVKALNFNNPRKLKRILNRYVMFLNLYGAHYDKYTLPSVVHLLVIAEYFPEVFQALIYNLEADGEKRFGDSDFDWKGFVERYKLDTRRFTRNEGLFKISQTSDRNKPQLREIFSDVFSITRLF